MDANKIDTSSSTEFIDEAQSAVIRAVDNVSEMISETTKISEFDSVSEHHEVFYQSPEFWVGMAFVLVVAALAKPISKLVKSALNKRQENIIKRINDAENLRNEAQLLLAQYERKFLNAKDEAQEILDKSNSEIKNLTEYKLQKMEEELASKQNDVDKLINTAIEKTRTEINTLASTKAINIAKSYIIQNIDYKQHEKLIDTSIDNILKVIKP
jgi:F-type H+-transporting ATPase subunit b